MQINNEFEMTITTQTGVGYWKFVIMASNSFVDFSMDGSVD